MLLVPSCAITVLKVIEKHWSNVSCFRSAFMLNSKSVSAIGPFNQIRSYSRPRTSLMSEPLMTLLAFCVFHTDISQEINCSMSLQCADIYSLERAENI